MGRKRTLNRMEQRAPYQEEEEEFEEDEEQEEEEDEELSDDDDEEEEDVDEDEEEEEVKPKKKKARVTRARKPRASKNPRMKVVWKVLDNSNKPVATFDYTQKEEAEAHALKLQTEKNKGIYFVQPVKVPIEEE